MLELPALAPDPGDQGEPEFKRLVGTGDWHVGHHFGLTPPFAWESMDPRYPKRAKRGAFQRALWEAFDAAIAPLRPIHTLALGGDAVDGKGERSGSRELLTPDRNEQMDMAAAIVDFIAPKQVRFVYGTPYHTGKEEDFEDQFPGKIKCTKDVIGGGHGFYNVNGCTVDDKHFTRGSDSPRGRFTGLAGDQEWNELWAARGRQPKANLLRRPHVHFFAYCGGQGWIAATVPPWCYGSAFGIRICRGWVDIGLLRFDIYKDGSFTWAPTLADFPALKASVESL
jgi:hypothetical protein